MARCIAFNTTSPGRVAQSVGHLTRDSGVLGSIPGLAAYFRFSFRFFKKGSCQLQSKPAQEKCGCNNVASSLIRTVVQPIVRNSVFEQHSVFKDVQIVQKRGTRGSNGYARIDVRFPDKNDKSVQTR